MNKYYFAILTASMISAASYAEVSATITGVTDYIYDGVSQSDNGAALQGSIDYSKDQFYAGIWTSNIDSPDPDYQQEIDYYIGWADSINDRVGYDVSVLYYQYPGTDDDLDYDYIEYLAKLTIDNFWIQAGYNPNYFGDTGRAWLARIGHNYAINDTYTLEVELGTHKMTERDGDGFWFNHDKYNYWKIGVSRQIMTLDVNLSYTDTNVSDENSEEYDDTAREAIVLSVGKTF